MKTRQPAEDPLGLNTKIIANSTIIIINSHYNIVYISGILYIVELTFLEFLLDSIMVRLVPKDKGWHSFVNR